MRRVSHLEHVLVLIVVTWPRLEHCWNSPRSSASRCKSPFGEPCDFLRARFILSRMQPLASLQQKEHRLCTCDVRASSLRTASCVFPQVELLELSTALTYCSVLLLPIVPSDQCENCFLAYQR